MRSCFGILFVLLVMGALTCVDAAPPKAPPSATLDADKLHPGVFTGTLVNTPNSDRIFTVDVVYQKIQLKPGTNLGRINQNLQRQYNHIVQLQNSAMRPPSRRHNPMQAMQQLQNAVVQFQRSVAQTEANLFQVVNAKQKVDFQAEENVKVRILQLPEQFDDKGNIKEYTREEKAELKGKDKHLPGYESSLDNLKPGQVVRVNLSVHRKPRPTPPPAASDDKEDKGKDLKTDKEKTPPPEPPVPSEATLQHRLQVNVIVIGKDGDSPGAPANPRKKRK